RTRVSLAHEVPDGTASEREGEYDEQRVLHRRWSWFLRKIHRARLSVPSVRSRHWASARCAVCHAPPHGVFAAMPGNVSFFLKVQRVSAARRQRFAKLPLAHELPIVAEH